MIIQPTVIKQHPLTSLLMLIALALVCGILSGFIALLIVLIRPDVVSLGADIMQSMTANEMRLIQAVSATGTFVLPPILLQMVEHRRGIRYFGTVKNTHLYGVVLVFILLSVSNPFIAWLDEINHMLRLPDSLRYVQEWMYLKEAELARLTRLILQMDGPAALIYNLIVIALIAAIGEELMFRGALMNIFMRMLKNPHLAIWLTAVIFSAIHFQFLGFLPRMLLGAMFGYLFYWSGNLVYPVLAHFCNNAVAVVFAYYLQQQGRSLDELDAISKSPAYMTILSAIFMVFLLLVFKRRYQRTTKSLNNEQGLG